MDEAEERRSWRVPGRLGGKRLDAVLVQGLPELSRSRLQALIREGHVRVDGELVRKPAGVVRGGAEVEVVLPSPPAPPDREEARQRLKVLYEDADLVVVDKPAGLLSHPAEGAEEVTLADLARAAYGDLPSLQGADRPGIVHRLDRDTSGVMVLGRSEEMMEELVRQFRDREVRKRYRALVHGEPRFDSDWIAQPVGRSKRRPDRMTVVSVEEGGREARTYYEVLERLGGAASLACEPKTGRTHQIRVHLTAIGHPVIGDRVYGGLGMGVGLGRGDGEEVESPARQMLHAEGLWFRHPREGKVVGFEAGLPGDFVRVLEGLRKGRRGEGE